LGIRSPDHHQALSDSSITTRGLHWDERRQRMTAIISFSNANYDSEIEPRHDDTSSFALPGIRYDQAGNVFYITSKTGWRAWSVGVG